MKKNQFEVMAEVNAAISMIAFKKKALVVGYEVRFERIKIHLHSSGCYSSEILEFFSISDLIKYSESL